MAQYRIDYKIEEDFGEPTEMTTVITCPADKPESEVILDFLAKFDNKTFVSLIIKREV